MKICESVCTPVFQRTKRCKPRKCYPPMGMALVIQDYNIPHRMPGFIFQKRSFSIIMVGPSVRQQVTDSHFFKLDKFELIASHGYGFSYTRFTKCQVSILEAQLFYNQGQSVGSSDIVLKLCILIPVTFGYDFGKRSNSVIVTRKSVHTLKTYGF